MIDPAKLDALIRRHFSELPDGTLVIKKADFTAKFLPLYDKLTPEGVTIRASTKRASEGPNWGSVKGLNLKAWAEFVTYRREIKKPIRTTRPAHALVKMSSDADEQAKIIAQSMENEWTGLFPLKQDQRRRRNDPTPERNML